MTSHTQALIFVSHGAPSFALDTTSQAATNLLGLGELLHSAKAVIVLSPHFATRDLSVNDSDSPSIIHDFYGFPDALYQLDYHAPGSKSYALEITQHLASKELNVALNNNAKWDHGLWIPMRYLSPNGDKTIIQLSYPANWTLAQLAQLGDALGELRHHGFALLMSGGISHNFADLKGSNSQSAPYVDRLRAELKRFAETHNQQGLVDYVSHNSDFKRAHPTFEHFAPLFIAFFAALHTDKVTWHSAPVALNALTMDSISWTVND